VGGECVSVVCPGADIYGGAMFDSDASSRADATEVGALSEAYEAALLRNDVQAMNEAFWTSPNVLRFGIEDMQVGSDEVVLWRQRATPVSAQRRLLTKTVLAIAPGVVAVDLTFRDGDRPMIGRQSQIWARQPEGWRIVRAHVSVIPG
jgi:ketosteroid isomerase-like protein